MLRASSLLSHRSRRSSFQALARFFLFAPLAKSTRFAPGHRSALSLLDTFPVKAGLSRKAPSSSVRSAVANKIALSSLSQDSSSPHEIASSTSRAKRLATMAARVFGASSTSFPADGLALSPGSVPPLLTSPARSPAVASAGSPLSSLMSVHAPSVRSALRLIHLSSTRRAASSRFLRARRDLSWSRRFQPMLKPSTPSPIISLSFQTRLLQARTNQVL